MVYVARVGIDVDFLSGIEYFRRSGTRYQQTTIHAYDSQIHPDEVHNFRVLYALRGQLS